MKAAWLTVCSSAAPSANEAHCVGAVAAEQQARAERERDDAEVLDGRVREQPLEVALEERVGDAAERRQAAEDEHRRTDPGGGGPSQSTSTRIRP